MPNTGQHPWLSVEPLGESCLETLNEACSALTQAANDMAQIYDAHCREALLYEIGDKVWLNSQNIMMTQPTKNLDHKWLSPYSVKNVILCSAYHLKIPPQNTLIIQLNPPGLLSNSTEAL